MTTDETRSLMRWTRYCLLSFKDDPDWDDILAEGYLGMWRAVRAWRPEAPYALRTSVRTYARSQVFSYVRKRRRYRECVEFGEEQDLAEGFSTEESETAADWDTHLEGVLIRARMERIGTPRQLSFLTRRMDRGETLDEIAAAAGVQKPTVRFALLALYEKYCRRWGESAAPFPRRV